MGMKLTKVHRVASFDQSRWLRPYIGKNTSLRRAAVDDFNRARIKLMVNFQVHFSLFHLFSLFLEQCLLW